MKNAMMAILLAVLFASPAVAQDWAAKMFETTSHDFGSVARSAKTEFRFTLTNRYLEDVHIASVRSTCGCTTPTIVKPWLKTHEQGAIVTRFNTRQFRGAKGATVTVTFDRPYPAEVQLQVQGFIRDGG